MHGKLWLLIVTKGGRKVAVVTVDFDGTLYQGNSFKIMFKIAKKKFTLKQWLVVIAGLIQAIFIGVFKGKDAFRHQFFIAFAKSFKGKTEQEMALFFQELVSIGKKDVHEDLVEKIREHQQQGDTIILLSGALRPFLEMFVQEVKLDVHIISTSLLYDQNGVCTGEIGQIINGASKVEKVKDWLQAYSRKEDDALKIWAYADSESDIPLFELATYPVVVNPDEAMLAIAKKREWPVFSS